MEVRAALQRKRKVREDKKPACDTCRTQKLRCDASLDYSRPCTRCRRKQTVCVVQEHRRKKIGLDGGPTTPLRMSQNATIVDTEISSTTVTVPSTSSFTPSVRDPTFVDEENELFVHLAPASMNPTETEPQTIEGICVEASNIDVCFARFFNHFAPLSPILSAVSTPNQTFRESPLKFWVITTIGSRKCHEDPTLFSTLSPHVETLALQSLCVGRLSPHPIVEAYLLMCNFHLSTDRPFWRSVYFTLSSAVIPITLQSGMHPCLSVQGLFSSIANPELERGTKLWAYAVILNQRTMSLQGYPITDDALRHLLWGHDCCANLPSWIAFEGRITAHIATFHQTVADLELNVDPTSYSRTLKSRISASEVELFALKRSVCLDDLGPLSALSITIARLQLRSFAFVASPSGLDHTDIMQLAEAAIATMDLVSNLEQTLHISLACPNAVFQGIQLSACTILKLLKSYRNEMSLVGIREKDMISALFSAINICKAISVVNNDIPAKVAEILGQLWSSDSVYRAPDGGEVLPLKVRNRQSMNVVFDCLYWWRKLFLTQNNSMNQHFGSTNPVIAGEIVEGYSELNQSLFDDWESWGFDWGFDFSESLNIPTAANEEVTA